MTLRIAILDDYVNQALSLAPWGSLPDCEAVAFDTYIGGDDDRVAAALKDFDIVVCMRERTRLPANVIERLPKLKLIVTTGARNPSIDSEAAKKRGIPVCGSPLISFAAAEHAWALIMALARRTSVEDRAMKAGKWQVEFPVTLGGKTLGVLGFGRLGKLVAGYGKAFNMNVIAWSPSLTAEAAAEHGVTRVEHEQLYADSDFLSIHVVLNKGTQGLVGARQLGLMKPTAYLVNTSRGPVIDEAALIDALNRRAIAGVGLDVFDVEPLPVDHPLRRFEQAVLTGHTGYVSREAFALGYGGAVEDIKAWLDGKPIRVLNA
jgi:phosphoglycerate dehydrogenase-like enzyme